MRAGVSATACSGVALGGSRRSRLTKVPSALRHRDEFGTFTVLRQRPRTTFPNSPPTTSKPSSRSSQRRRIAPRKMSGSCPSTGSGSSAATHILIGETYNSSRSASGPQAGPAASQSSPPVVFSAPVSAVTKAPDGSGRWSGTRAFESSEGSTIRKKTTRCLKTCLLWIGNPCPMVRVFSGRNKAPPNLARICFRRIVRVDPWES